MNISFKKYKNVLVIELNGEIDHHSASSIKKKIDDVFFSYPIKNMILDYKNITFMDSAGIGLILGRYKNVSSVDGRLILCNLSPCLLQIIKMSGIEKLILTKSDLDEAISYFTGGEKYA